MFDELIATVRTLRRRCPWDRKQTAASTRPLLLNETYELEDALRRRDDGDVAEELGDYLFMGVFLADVLATERGIKLKSVLTAIVQKLKERHPHIYGTARVKDADEVLANWEVIKRRQKQRRTVLEGIPVALPALQQAELIQERCRRVGFDWDDPAAVLDKVEEEVAELRVELKRGRANRPAVREEAGDLMFALVNLCRHLGLDAEGTLKDANRKFTARFNKVEAEFRRAGSGLSGASLEEMEAAWQRAKKPAPRRSGRRATRRRG
ncbi:MAG: nucleoside triphosphate pyrophosphohydrolase [bacterium]